MIVSHGTAMSIYIARVLRVDPVALWRGFSMPTAVVLHGNEMKIINAEDTLA
jgi:hypothetical protein